MKIGLSLPVTYLSGDCTNLEDKILRNAFGVSKEFLPQLKKQGISSIELKFSSHESVTQEIVNVALHWILQADLDFSIHVFLPENIMSKKCILEIYPFLGLVMDDIKNNNTIMTVHSYSSKICNMKDIARLSGRALGYIARILDKEDINIRFAVELIRYHGYSDPSTSYDGILKILKYADHPKIGICWDIGHSFWNTSNKKLKNIPPILFLCKTIHTHIHDLGINGTHYSLSRGAVPIEKMLKPLILNGYSGIFNLEFNPVRLQPDIQKEIFFSIKRIQKCLPDR